MKLLLLVFVFISLRVSLAASEPSINKYTAEQVQFLEEVKIETFKVLEKNQKEAYLLRQCFISDKLCESHILTKKSIIRSGIIQRNEEYRLLVGLAVGSEKLRHLPYSSLGIGFKTVYFNNTTDKELSDIKKIEERDSHWIEYKLSREDQRNRRPTDEKMLNFRMQYEVTHSRLFYKNQAYMLINQLPFIHFIQSAKPSDKEIALALSEYLKRLDDVFLELYDAEKTPLESFVIYTPIVQRLIREAPSKEAILMSIQFRQQALYGFKAWVEKNKPSITMAGFATCSFVSAVLQAWPVALTCGGFATAFTGRQLYVDYYNLQEDFTLWMAGVQSHASYTDRQAKIMYTSLTLLFIGQGISSTIIGIEASLATMLSQIPQTAATRFTSLAALRESSFDFAKSFIEFRSKDLGGSLIAQTHAENARKSVELKRSDRLFSYGDFIILEESINRLE